jgi:tRNA U34 5-carboxymethylaminomethyl modifying enzyme MnmG/GidA
MSQLEDLLIPDNFDYEKLVSLGTEANKNLKK